MTVGVLTVAALSLGVWIYLLVFRGGFWRADQRLNGKADLVSCPDLAAVIPARNEVDVIGRAVASILNQDYRGRLDVIVVDDGSDDGTASAARSAAEQRGEQDRLTVVKAPPLQAGWTGKMWAVSHGVQMAPENAEYLLLTDADIEHAPDVVRRLVAKAVAEDRHLVSLMVLLHCRSFVERLLIPAFVFFFQKLYPFPWINDRESRVAGAAGGCMLVHRETLRRTGGIEAIGNKLIDDCALARQIKKVGSIWLGLAEQSRSIRPYDGLGEIWRMVARTAFTQLGHSALRLAGTVLGMLIVYVVPPAALVFGIGASQPLTAVFGGGALVAMLVAYWPTWRLYGRPGAAFFLLPVAAFLYMAMTVDSALRHWRNRGGAWKGRTYPHAAPDGVRRP